MFLPTSAKRIFPSAAVLAVAFGASTLSATNGMNLEGYGPESTAMGGAAMAFDNGTAAVMNNPATLSLMEGSNRLDLALGMLGPSITATNNSIMQSADSESTSFWMPALGYAHRTNDMVYGFGVFGQGGMGCEYLPDSWRGLGFGLENRTEVSIGRAIVPFAVRVTDKLHLAASVDFVWAGMDLKMAMSGSQFFDLVDPNQQVFGTADGQLVQTLGGILQQMPEGTMVDYAYFDYSDGSDFTGEAMGFGWAAKIGAVYEVSSDLSLGLTYHSRTSLSDLDTSNAELSFQLDVPGMGKMPQTLGGDIAVREFEWPAMLAGGVAWRPNGNLLLALDVKQVFWSDVMDSFRMRFVTSEETENGPFAGQDLNAELYQNWSDQTVFALGAAYRINKQWTIRAGYNYGSDPVPSQHLNCLFPAIVEQHVTGGLGWAWSERSGIDFSIVYGFEEVDTSGYNVTVSHSQLNFQLMYSYRFGK